MGKLGKKLKRSRQEALEASLEPGASSALDLGALVPLASRLCAQLPLYHSAAFRPLRTVLYPLLQAELASGVHFERQPTGLDTPAALPLTTACLAPLLALCASSDAVRQLQSHRDLRRALHPLVLDLGEREGVRSGESNVTAAISNALRHRDWAAALQRLRELRLVASASEAVRLGSLQRWVNAVDIALGEDTGSAAVASGGGAGEEGGAAATAGSEHAVQLLVLDSLLRVSQSIAFVASPHTGSIQASIVRHPLWRCKPADTSASSPHITSAAAPSSASTGARIVHTVPSATRRPPCPYDLHVYALPPSSSLKLLPPSGAPSSSSSSSSSSSFAPLPPLTPFDVPGVPGARLLPNALSPTECASLISMLEAIGYAQDAVPGIDCVHLLADKAALLDPLFQRLALAPGFLPPHLPATRGGPGAPPVHLTGINARWRCFRYTEGVTYKAHIDGAWPGCGLSPVTGLLENDAEGTLSRFTLLLYLNSGFEGGGTTFFCANAAAEGVIDARGVEPCTGSALIFPHGEAAGSLVHEGSAVARGGVKYIVRSDVLYTLNAGGRRLAEGEGGR